MKPTAPPRARIVRLGALPTGARGRRVPWRLRAALRLRAVDVQVAWLLAVLGLGVCFAVVPRVDARAAQLTGTTTALVAQVTTDEMHYIYAVGAQSYRGVERLADVAGTPPAAGLTSLYKVGDAVRVTYDPLAPARSTVRGFAGAIGRGSLWLLAWPGLAVLLAFGAMVLRHPEHRWRVRMLAHGEAGRGQLVARLVAGDETELVVFGAAELPRPVRREVEAEVPLVYLREQPDLAILLDDLPGYPRLSDGAVSLTAGVGLAAFVLPALTAVGAIALAAVSL